MLFSARQADKMHKIMEMLSVRVVSRDEHLDFQRHV